MTLAAVLSIRRMSLGCAQPPGALRTVYCRWLRLNAPHFTAGWALDLRHGQTCSEAATDAAVSPSAATSWQGGGRYVACTATAASTAASADACGRGATRCRCCQDAAARCTPACAHQERP
eukprot:TRINITY_DN9830_c0_g1_i2.p1 TRINITY_DN9830_c0_g1~~TRINITY_DN9830_c0_g1_i2.p1  ORF type:complete len:120 (+),score=20.14 TRINITY_DN9830_c0_g1_i2:311-670(+)